MIPYGTRLGPYEIVSAVGAGGMGEVYAARDTRLDRSVAIKVLSPQFSGNSDFRQRFEREARIISGLNHPNICTLHDVGEATIDSSSPQDQPGESSSVHYLVMELCEGESLAGRLQKGPLPIDQVLRYGIQIAAALDRAHRAGVTHRDLKPANVMLTKSGAKLLDFGLAKPAEILGPGAGPRVSPSILAGAATQHRPLTTEGTIMGTFQYMAPEQLEGGEADARSDIFAFGAVLYEMITGRCAFGGKTKASLIASILDRQPQPIAEIQPLAPAPLARVVSTCLAKEPEERWQSARDLMRELEWIRGGLASSTEVRSFGATRREWVAWALAGVLAVVAVAAFFRADPVVTPRRPLVSAIAPPSETQFAVTGDAAGAVTLSPDGRWATFVAAGKEGPQLWLQSLESGEVRALPGTQRGTFPFWSPDSRSIGYFAQAKLMVIDIDGGASRYLADASDGRGGSWGIGGDILFAPSTQSGIHRISSAGGGAVAVTTLESPHTTHRWPEFTDDGKHFVYLAASHADPLGSPSAHYAALDGSVDRKLLDTASSTIPHGEYLLYVRANRLLAQRVRNGSLEGEPAKLRENVLHDPGTWRSVFSVSRDGLLAYHPAGATLGSHLVWFDRDGTQLDRMPPRPIGDIAISPDGKKVAIVVGDPKGILFVRELERGVETRLSFVDEAVNAPLWTRDGRHLLFQTVSPAGFRLYMKPADGSAPERLIHQSTGEIRPTSISPDGSLVLYNSTVDGRAAVMMLPMTGGSPEVLLSENGDVFDGRFSPDGRWICYQIADATGRFSFAAPFPGPGGKWQLSSDTVYNTLWNPNGREIFYLTADELVSVEVSPEPGSLKVGSPRRLFPVSVNTNFNVFSSSDGERFLVVMDQPTGSGVAVLVTDWEVALK